MATKKPAGGDAAAQIQDNATAYLDKLLGSHERFVEAVGTARARAARVADKFVETLLAGQRDALELGKAVAAEPAAYAKHMEAFVQSLSTAQERALELAKIVYREQTDAAGEARAITERAFEAGKTLGQPFGKLAGQWLPAAK
jgi:hypothetical protein